MDFSSSKVVRVNKDHKCEFCTEIIPKRTDSQYTSGKFDGNMFSYYICDRCNKFINEHKEVREDVAYWGFEYGDYQSWLDYYGIKEDKDEKDDSKR